MNLEQIFKNNGIEEDKVATLIEVINGELPKHFIPKTQYNKKIQLLTELQEKNDDLTAKVETLSKENGEDKYNQLQKEFDDYKKEIQTEKDNTTKTSKLKEQLKKDGANEKIINLLLKEFDLANVVIEEENIKDWETLSKNVKEDYKDFFAKVEDKGTENLTPPNNTNNVFNGKDPFLEGLGF